MSISYKSAGVDIEAGNSLVERIKPLAKSTSRIGANADLGGFGGLFDLAACRFQDPVLVSANDGVGTKLKVAFEMDKHDTVGIDLVAMCVNDLVVQGAEPLFFLDYFATGGLKEDVAYQVIKGIAEGCRQANCALVGGETAEMPGMYAKDHYDLAGFSVGAAERSNILPKTNDIVDGDVIIGLPSSGIHSNGYSLVRHLIEKNDIDYNAPAEFDKSKPLGESLLKPTRIYVQSCLGLAKEKKVKAMAHITGGGFTENIPRALPDHLAAEIDCSSWQMQEVFLWLQNLGKIETLEMLKTFNCGIGMVLIVSPDLLEDAMELLSINGEVEAKVIGKITPRIDDAVIYKNLEAFGGDK